ncbi:hypothetical protein M5G07_09630 [Serratia symbiotica]|nr:hypothetical protein [Serratia symbiotica]
MLLAAEILAAQLFGEPLPSDAQMLAVLNPNRMWIRKLLKNVCCVTRSLGRAQQFPDIFSGGRQCGLVQFSHMLRTSI